MRSVGHKTIPSDWKSKLAQCLRDGMRYCFPLPNGRFPNLSESDFSGDLNDGGFLGVLTSYVLYLRKKAYSDGFKEGAKVAKEGFTTRGSDESPGMLVNYDDDLADLCIERSWIEHEKNA